MDDTAIESIMGGREDDNEIKVEEYILILPRLIKLNLAGKFYTDSMYLIFVHNDVVYKYKG